MGFTLIECILTMLIISMIFLLFPLLIKTYEHINQSLSTEEDYEWNLFLIQLRKEMRESDGWDVSNNRLFLKMNDQMIMYEQYGTVLRRRVDSEGHEIVLQNIDQVLFGVNDLKLQVHIQFINHHQRDAYYSSIVYRQ
ncbi:competence type IV pilus minor pilin ComGF [Heyndrickxia oleronia]|uniref:Competence type IV pilus minor pilin ComGF n=2 Tax=Heyndrickxia oleronia TaxID=38875 RepID=A0AAW6SVV2_9BACI|nr:competence type IV pilus minor pilin ComGF [Heyndrickxia oleronia]